MKLIVTPGQQGLISNAGQITGQALAENALIVDYAGSTLDIPPMSAAIVEAGVVKIVANWLGSGPWYDQDAATADRMTPIQITEYGIEPLATWAMTPRAETAAEKKARLAAEAAAAAAAEAERIAKITVSDVQFAAACATTGLITEAEAIAWASGGVIPAVLEAAISALPAADQFSARIKAAGATSYERASPIVAALGAALGKTSAELDALFVLAASL